MAALMRTHRPFRREICAMIALLTSLFLAGCAQPQKHHGSSLRILSIEPPSPAVLAKGQRMTITIGYTITNTQPMRIFARPFTKGRSTPDYSAHPSFAFTAGTGEIK